MTVIPLLFTLLFGYAMSPVLNMNLPFVIYDMDNSAQSRQLADLFYEYPNLEVSEGVESSEEIKQLMLKGDLRGAVILPKDFGKNLQSKNGTEALVLIDYENFMDGSTILQACSSIFASFNGAIQMKLLAAGGVTPYEAEQYVYTLNVVDRGLYNPTNGYLYFLFPGLFAIFCQQTYLAAAVPYLIEKKNHIRAMKEMGLSIRMSQGIAFGIAVKLMSLVLFGIAGLFMCLLTLNQLFSFPLRGDMRLIVVSYLCFSLAMIAVSFVISAIFDDPVHGTQFNMFITIPSLLTSGFAWPVFMMPDGFLEILDKVWPLYYFINPLRDILLKDADFGAVAGYCSGCLIYAAVWMAIGLMAYFIKINVIRSWQMREGIEEIGDGEKVLLLKSGSEPDSVSEISDGI